MRRRGTTLGGGRRDRPLRVQNGLDIEHQKRAGQRGKVSAKGARPWRKIGFDADKPPQVLRFGPKAKQFSRILSNTSRPLTGRPAHGDLAESRSGSAPFQCGMSCDRTGADWPVWANSRWRRSTRTTNFFLFQPLPESPVSCPPHASSTVAPPRVPTGFTGSRRRSGAIRCAVRHDSAFEPSRFPHSALILST